MLKKQIEYHFYYYYNQRELSDNALCYLKTTDFSDYDEKGLLVFKKDGICSERCFYNEQNRLIKVMRIIFDKDDRRETYVKYEDTYEYLNKDISIITRKTQISSKKAEIIENCEIYQTYTNQLKHVDIGWKRVDEIVAIREIKIRNNDYVTDRTNYIDGVYGIDYKVDNVYPDMIRIKMVQKEIHYSNGLSKLERYKFGKLIYEGSFQGGFDKGTRIRSTVYKYEGEKLISIIKNFENKITIILKEYDENNNLVKSETFNREKGKDILEGYTVFLYENKELIGTRMYKYWKDQIILLEYSEISKTKEAKREKIFMNKSYFEYIFSKMRLKEKFNITAIMNDYHIDFDYQNITLYDHAGNIIITETRQNLPQRSIISHHREYNDKNELEFYMKIYNGRIEEIIKYYYH